MFDTVLDRFFIPKSSGDCFLVNGPRSYRDARRIYTTLQERALNKVPGAQALYEALSPFFHHKKLVCKNKAYSPIGAD